MNGNKAEDWGRGVCQDFFTTCECEVCRFWQIRDGSVKYIIIVWASIIVIKHKVCLMEHICHFTYF